MARADRSDLPRLCLVQMNCHGEVAVNVARAADRIRAAAQRDAHIICLPELFNTPYFCHSESDGWWALAETIPGPSTDAIGALARRYGVVVVAPIYERAPDGEHYNSAAVIGVDGSILSVYRKSSIPLSIMADWSSREKYYFAPGDSGFVVVETPFDIRLGILICYDRHFPEAARVLALGGADLILVPTATGGPSRSSWDVELRAHAIANICYVGGVNRVGHDDGDSGRPYYYGCSLVSDFRGEVVAAAGDNDECLVFATLDRAAMASARDELGWFRDRRPDLYGEVTRQRRRN